MDLKNDVNKVVKIKIVCKIEEINLKISTFTALLGCECQGI